MHAIRTMPSILAPGCSGRMSSSAPSAHISAAPAMIPQNPWLWPSATDGITIAPRIARPPSSGVGRCVHAALVDRAVDDARHPGQLRYDRRQQHRQQERDRKADHGRLIVDQPAVHVRKSVQAAAGTLPRPVQAVAGVAQAGQDVALVVELAVERRDHRLDVGVVGLRRCHSGAATATSATVRHPAGALLLAEARWRPRPSRRWPASGRARSRRARPGRPAACSSTRPAAASARRGRGRRSRPGRPGSGRAPRPACRRPRAARPPRPASCPTRASRTSAPAASAPRSAPARGRGWPRSRGRPPARPTSWRKSRVVVVAVAQQRRACAAPAGGRRSTRRSLVAAYPCAKAGYSGRAAISSPRPLAQRRQVGGRIERLQDDRPHLAHVVLVEAAHGRGRRADAHARGDRRRALVVRHGVAVDRDRDLVQALLGVLARPLRGAQVELQQVGVGAVGEQPAGRRPSASGPASRRWSRPAAGSRGSASVWASLKQTALAATTWQSGPPCRPGKTARSTALACSARAQHQAGARAGQRLVRGRGDDVGVLHRVRVQAGGDQARRSAPCPPSAMAPTSSAISRKRAASMTRG